VPVRRTVSRWPALLPLLAAAVALVGCGPGDAPPDPAALVADLTSADARKSGDARLALISLGEPATPALVDLLQNGAPRERVLAATTLWGMGARASSAVPALTVALGDADPELRVACAMALENMGPAARDAAPALAAALGDPERPVRQAAVKALGAIGPAASPALPALEAAIQRESWPEAEEAVRRIHGGSSAANAVGEQ
jgi:HEAT repeat protein